MATSRKSGRKAAKKGAARKGAAKKGGAKKAARKGAAKRGAARKAPARKGAARKAPAKKRAAKKAGAKKATAKKRGAKKAAKKTTRKRAPNPAFMKPMQPSADLAAVVGSNPLPRTEVTKKVWAYIKKHNLQDPRERRMINADANLKKVFGGKNRVSMFEMTRHVNNHLK
jgi:upstream activation factor subunit UAF30